MEYVMQQPSNLEWEAREVVRELNKRPHLLVSIEIKGTYFPHRSAPPFARIVQPDGRTKRSWFVDVSDDNLSLKAYFTLDMPESGKIEFGYGDMVIGAVPLNFDRTKVRVLDRARLPKDIVLTTEDHVVERRQPK